MADPPLAVAWYRESQWTRPRELAAAAPSSLLDVPAWFQFVVVPAAPVPEVWASNSVPVLIRS